LLGDPGDVFVCVLPYQLSVFPNTAGVGEEGLFLLANGSRYATNSKGLPDPRFKDVQWTTVPADERDPYGWHSPPWSLRAGAIGDIETMELVPFSNRQELIDHVSRYCVRPLPALKIEALWNPDRDRFTGKGSSPWDLVIVAPVDTHAEELARAWIDSPNDVLRSNAVRILRHVHSERNVQVLGKFARQPTTTQEQDVVRTIALSTLVDWGEPVDWSRDHVDASPNGPSTFNFWFCAAMVPLASIFYWRRSRQSGRWRRIAVASWIFLLSLIVIILLRSLIIMDGFEGGNWKGGAVRGEMYLIWMMSDDATHRSPFLFENPRNVPELMDPPLFYSDDWGRGAPVRSFVRLFGIESMDQDIFPIWRSGVTIRLPLWFSIPFWLLPWPMFYCFGMYRRWRARGRGLPVVMGDSGR
jgi:hypothetical protein